MAGKILTREEYADALVRFYGAARQEAVERLMARTFEDAIDRALARFDQGSQVYGPWDLTSRDWVPECDQELDDAPAYLVAEKVREERGLPGPFDAPAPMR